MKYRILIEQDEDGIHVAEVPALPGCVSQGRTRPEAIANATEAIASYLESLQKHGEAIPPSITEEYVCQAIDEGLAELDAGEGIEHQEMKRRHAAWLD